MMPFNAPGFRRHVLLSLVFGYLAIHLAVAFFSIRIWPFTDYPMFSDAIGKDHEILVYRYAMVTRHGSQELLGRSFANCFGVGELNVTALIQRGETGALKEVFRRWLAEQAEPSRVAEILVIRVKTNWPFEANDRELRIYEDVVLRIPREELQ